MNHLTNGGMAVHTHSIASCLMLIGVLLLGWSCEKEPLPEASEPKDVNRSIENRYPDGTLGGPGETVLGNMLNNPYALENVNQAYFYCFCFIWQCKILRGN